MKPWMRASYTSRVDPHADSSRVLGDVGVDSASNTAGVRVVTNASSVTSWGIFRWKHANSASTARGVWDAAGASTCHSGGLSS